MNFMFAGHDTTANTMCWALYELARNPAVQVSRAFKRATLQGEHEALLYIILY